MIIDIPASITLGKALLKRRYEWKSATRSSIYYSPSKRIVLRISCSKFGKQLRDVEKIRRQVSLDFIKEKSKWVVVMRRTDSYDITLTSSVRDKDDPHQAVELVINDVVPSEIEKEMLKEALDKRKTSITKPVIVRLDTQEWKDFDLKPWDFLYHTEIYAKELMEYALKSDFKVSFVPKGREFDLQLIREDGKKFIIGILSHIAKTNSRSKQHRISKALLDIAKMLSTLFEDKSLVPVIITQPFEFDGSWTFTTTNYLKFYEKQFGFHYIFTDFKKKWVSKVCRSLKNINIVSK